MPVPLSRVPSPSPGRGARRRHVEQPGFPLLQLPGDVQLHLLEQVELLGDLCRGAAASRAYCTAVKKVFKTYKFTSRTRHIDTRMANYDLLPLGENGDCLMLSGTQRRPMENPWDAVLGQGSMDAIQGTYSVIQLWGADGSLLHDVGALGPAIDSVNRAVLSQNACILGLAAGNRALVLQANQRLRRFYVEQQRLHFTIAPTRGAGVFASAFGVSNMLPCGTLADSDDCLYFSYAVNAGFGGRISVWSLGGINNMEKTMRCSFSLGGGGDKSKIVDLQRSPDGRFAVALTPTKLVFLRGSPKIKSTDNVHTTPQEMLILATLSHTKCSDGWGRMIKEKNTSVAFNTDSKSIFLGTKVGCLERIDFDMCGDDGETFSYQRTVIQRTTYGPEHGFLDLPWRNNMIFPAYIAAMLALDDTHLLVAYHTAAGSGSRIVIYKGTNTPTICSMKHFSLHLSHEDGIDGLAVAYRLVRLVKLNKHRFAIVGHSRIVIMSHGLKLE